MTWLPQIGYGEYSGDLVRFRESSTDDLLTSALARHYLLDASDRDHHGRDLSDDDVVLLNRYIERRTVQALRTGSSAPVRDAALATTLLVALPQGRPSAVKLPFFVARELGESLDLLRDSCREVAPTYAADELERVVEELSRVVDLEQVGYEKVATMSGPGLLRAPLPTRTQVDSMFGLGATKTHHVIVESGRHQECTQAAVLAVELANAIEGDPALLCSPMNQSDLASGWFDSGMGGPYIDVTGCVQFSVSPKIVPTSMGPDDGFLESVEVLVAELADNGDARALADRVVTDDDQTVWAWGQDGLVVVVAGTPQFGESDGPESQTELHSCVRAVGEVMDRRTQA